MFNLSLGAVNPLPITWRGTIKKPAAASEVFRINFLREELMLFLSNYMVLNFAIKLRRNTLRKISDKAEGQEEIARTGDPKGKSKIQGSKSKT
jgi:hypothetical protein